MSTKPSELPGLNALRFFAAATVYVHHAEQIKMIFGLPTNYTHRAIGNLGGLAVTFFFVLSGFLITYLLLIEREKTGKTAIRNFYIRRILRIWPLYYFVVLMGLFVLPQLGGWFAIPTWSEQIPNGFGIKTFLYLFMLPNLVMLFYAPFPNISQVWSIGVEEQFYLIWPHFIRFGRKVIYAFLGTLALFMVAHLGLRICDSFIQAKWLEVAKQFVSELRFGCMAIGACIAWVYHFDYQPLLSRLYGRRLQIVVLTALTFMLIFGSWPPLWASEIYSILFGLVILNVSTNPDSILKLRSPTLNYFGKLSFGLYMYHVPAVVFAIHLCLKMVETGWMAQSLSGSAIEILGAAFTVLTAYLSYRFLEKPFLRMKRAFN